MDEGEGAVDADSRTVRCLLPVWAEARRAHKRLDGELFKKIMSVTSEYPLAFFITLFDKKTSK